MRYIIAAFFVIVIAAIFVPKDGRRGATGGGNAVPMTDLQAGAMARAIAGAGYNCPAAKLAFSEGQDALGTVMQVYCGPAGRQGAYPDARFRVTARPNGQILVRPWQ